MGRIPRRGEPHHEEHEGNEEGKERECWNSEMMEGRMGKGKRRLLRLRGASLEGEGERSKAKGEKE